MKLGRWLSGTAILIVIGLAVAWLSGWFEPKIAPGELPVAEAALPAGATTFPVALIVEPAVEWTSGAVASARQVTVASRILARIEKVTVSAGDAVNQNDVLVQLDARDPQSRLAQAREASKAAVAQRELAQQEMTRADELLKRGVGTRQRYDQAVSALQMATAEVDRLTQVRREAETALSYTEVRAPVAGRVIDRLAEAGDTIAPGQALLRLYDPTTLRVETPVRESLAVHLQVGDRLRVQIDALHGSTEGVIEEIVPFAEPGARTLLVKVRLAPDGRLFAGLFARVAIPSGERQRLLVPATAITRIGQLEFATVLVDGRPAQRMVTTGVRGEDGNVEVLSGLAEGETVVLPPA